MKYLVFALMLIGCGGHPILVGTPSEDSGEDTLLDSGLVVSTDAGDDAGQPVVDAGTPPDCDRDQDKNGKRDRDDHRDGGCHGHRH